MNPTLTISAGPHFPSEIFLCMVAPMARRTSPLPAAASASDLAGLLASIGTGDRGALAQLYRRTSGKLYGICLRLLGSEAEAEEVLQDVYVLVWQKAGRFEEGRASPITWLAVLTRNKAIDRLRVRKPATAPIEAAEQVPDDAESALDLIERTQERTRLDGCLAELEDRHQAAIRSAFLDGVTYPELAEREAVPLGTMKSWIRRGLIRLKGCLER